MQSIGQPLNFFSFSEKELRENIRTSKTFDIAKKKFTDSFT